jgi:hypothetical protein
VEEYLRIGLLERILGVCKYVWSSRLDEAAGRD